MREYGFSLTDIFPYKDKIVDLANQIFTNTGGIQFGNFQQKTQESVARLAHCQISAMELLCENVSG